MPLDAPYALLLLVPASAAVGLLLARPAQALLTRLVAGTDTEFDDQLVAASHRPLALLIAIGASRLALEWITLRAPVAVVVREAQQALVILAVFWFLFRAIAVFQEAVPASRWGAQHPAFRSLVPMAARLARILVLVVGVLAVLSSFGYPVATLLAGLGIGGIAVAFAAQKTLEHFFGSVAIGVDQPFAVGDTVIVDGVEGDVEAIGLRSTRLRTADRTVVSIPNGRLADMRTENLGPRDRFRFRTMISLEYGTPAAAIERLRDAIEALLRAEAATWPDRVVVRVVALGESSVDLEAFCWVRTRDVDEFRRIREGFLLGILRAADAAGVALAFPTRTVVMRPAPETGR
jgi:MscS family membrane protein